MAGKNAAAETATPSEAVSLSHFFYEVLFWDAAVAFALDAALGLLAAVDLLAAAALSADAVLGADAFAVVALDVPAVDDDGCDGALAAGAALAAGVALAAGADEGAAASDAAEALAA